MGGHRVEALVHGALQLRLGLSEQFANLLDACAELHDSLIGHLRGSGLLGGALGCGGVFDRRPRSRDEHRESGNGEAYDEADCNQKGGFHDGFLRDSVLCQQFGRPNLLWASPSCRVERGKLNGSR